MPAPRSIFLLALVAITAVSAAFAVKPSAKPQEVFAPFWTSDPGWETELQLKNNLPSQSLTVTPVLRLASCEEIALDPVTLATNVSTPLEINQALLQPLPRWSISPAPTARQRCASPRFTRGTRLRRPRSHCTGVL